MSISPTTTTSSPVSVSPPGYPYPVRAYINSRCFPQSSIPSSYQLSIGSQFHKVCPFQNVPLFSVTLQGKTSKTFNFCPQLQKLVPHKCSCGIREEDLVPKHSQMHRGHHVLFCKNKVTEKMETFIFDQATGSLCEVEDPELEYQPRPFCPFIVIGENGAVFVKEAENGWVKKVINAQGTRVIPAQPVVMLLKHRPTEQVDPEAFPQFSIESCCHTGYEFMAFRDKRTKVIECKAFDARVGDFQEFKCRMCPGTCG
ncbi:unnamed protein product [Caenorhabditis nigoni]